MTFQLTREEIKKEIWETSAIALQNKITAKLLDKNITYVEMGGAIIFTHHVHAFYIEELPV